MKKKMIFALLLAGMSFATPSKVEAQETQRVVAGDGWRTYFSWYGMEGCYAVDGDCFPDDIIVIGQ
jgi:hypothetical protein